MIYLDFETFNDRPLKDGTYIYASTCEPLLLAWAEDDGPVHCIDFTDDSHSTTDFRRALNRHEVVVAHNSMFDRNVLRYTLEIDIPVYRWHDTMVQAYSHSLPGSLDALCEVLGIGEDKAKIKDGKRLIQLFCKPRPKNMEVRRATRYSHPEEWDRFVAYAKGDIEATREVMKRMPKWNYYHGSQEHAYWVLDQKINDRGMYIDLEFAANAVKADAREKARLKSQVREHTGGEVESATKRDQLLAYVLADYGIDLPDMQKSTLQRRIDDPDVPDALKDLLRLRLEASSTSATKYTALMKATLPNGRLCGTKQFSGAGRTARWAGRTFQPDNLPRPAIGTIAQTLGIPAKEVEGDEIGEFVDLVVRAVELECEDLVFPSVSDALSTSIRSVIVAPTGKKLNIADYSNIEGRGLAWLADEEWKLQAFRDFDNGEGHDLYKLAFARAFRAEPEEVDKWGRSVGKVFELMLGYEGGVGAFVTGAATYNLDLDELAERAYPSIPADVMAEAERFYQFSIEKNLPLYGLSRHVFCVCDSLKRMWRRSNSNIASWWAELRDLTRMAIANRGEEFTSRHVRIRVDGAWLRIILPSGRSLCYPSPKLTKRGVSYMGINAYTKQWSRINTHGGKLAENITQAFARDILACRQPAVEEAGYEIVLHVHDENVAETPDTDDYSAEELASIMSVVPSWAEGLPLAAAGYETYRYRKD